MRIGSTSCTVNYGIVVNGKAYEVNDIRFYNENGVVCHTDRGCLEKKSGYPKEIKEIELPVEEIKLRRKEKFDGNVFVITGRDKWLKYPTAILYIPAKMFGIHFVGNDIDKGIFQAYKVYEGACDIYIKEFSKSLAGKLYEIGTEYGKLHDNTRFLSFSSNFDEMENNLNKMKELIDEYKAEKERLKAIDPDELEL